MSAPNMYKIIILSALLVVVEGANIDEAYGIYVPVVVYPDVTTYPICKQYALSRDKRNIECTCADGNATTFVETNVLDVQIPNLPPISSPMIAVDTAEDVMTVVNVSCNCGGEDFQTRSALLKVNDNYLIAYAVNRINIHRYREKTIAYLFAKELPNRLQLESDLLLINELKNRTSKNIVCSQEQFDQLNLKH